MYLSCQVRIWSDEEMMKRVNSKEQQFMHFILKNPKSIKRTLYLLIHLLHVCHMHNKFFSQILFCMNEDFFLNVEDCIDVFLEKSILPFLKSVNWLRWVNTK